MRVHVPAILSVVAVATAQHTYNLTQAYAATNFEKYNCLTYAKLSAWLPYCLESCHLQANKADGCAPEDYTCHCINHQAYSKAIESCAFPPALGGNGTCTLQDLGKARPIVNAQCNFLNATLYSSYQGCNITLSKAKTYAILAEEESIAVGWPRTTGIARNGTHGDETNNGGATSSGHATHGANGCLRPLLVSVLAMLMVEMLR